MIINLNKFDDKFNDKTLNNMSVRQIKQIRKGVWEVENHPVPVRIYGTEKIVNSMEEDVINQARNVSRLPGIVRASLVMPDGHKGYGFPIGGVAAFDAEKGIISPGGIGYDINCLSGDTNILCEHGYYVEIKEFEENCLEKGLISYNLSKGCSEIASIEKFIKFKPKNSVYKIFTKSGEEITATEDHPFWTQKGMIPVKDLKTGEKLGMYHFKGVPYEEPDEKIILDEDKIKENLIAMGNTFQRNTVQQVIKHLKKIKILPLKYNSPQIPYLLKIIGFVLGDGCLYFQKGDKKGITAFYGKTDDLEEIRKDILKIGFTPSEYNYYEFENTACMMKVVSSSFAVLLFSLGVPAGKKVEQEYEVPAWVRSSRLWQKRLFLASLFGAEMSSPKVTNNGYNFDPPCFSMNKSKKFEENGSQFMLQIVDILSGFDIKTQKIGKREGKKGSKESKSVRFKAIISNDTENLINFYETINFEYDLSKRRESNAVVQYLKVKNNVIKEREKKAKKAKEFYEKGKSPSEIYSSLISPYINKRFLERSVYSSRKEGPRIPLNFETYDKYMNNIRTTTDNDKKIQTEYVWDEVVKIEKVNFNEFVYDFTLNTHHNFVANKFIVSNCGVRLLTTPLTEQDIKPKLKILTDELYKNIPSGVGKGGILKIGIDKIDEVGRLGAKWAIENNYGIKEDLNFMEENGCIDGADPGKVSQRAKLRGRDQLGTLGSGNHFLEIQKVEEIYDENTAKKFRLFKGQITIMVHCGSRGYGHQICDDYIKILLSAARKYHINLPHLELVCAPINSNEGNDYIKAMYCGANYAFCNREIITHWIRETFENLKINAEIKLMYDVCHNIAKFEKHKVDGEEKLLCVHRKGATRAFAAGRSEIPEIYRNAGQPVIVPGSMGTSSYVLVGTERAMEETYGSVCHGAGRVMSRAGGIITWGGEDIMKEMERKGQVIKSASLKVLAEEHPGVYKDIDEVVKSVEMAGLSRIVAKVVPLGIIKG
ncbi:MAG: RNA-splicing ligase RtcB [Candidatus Altarchaeum sp. CG12_big_fil_rev_8_21_14_0_65_33_22]|nr:MAG: RNA-splicing ligase RtcB [Candidatus Altarchaeum sp. CG12_big_fil_rev_8_21_14_0_65_33_22]